ncbi:hypothetical protein SporoP8_01570 [Sporosarcina ureae]|uniref:hypothetical protein n=1 Tax=Sporosarcina ureae TaxID=1571 RepID=UPI000A15E121|nr:hypothetical protein [Sporosarcina ureae]ARJ37683.1 hypothetical protein SporoP8_01570 [Sporosarcina ureae]
MVGKFFKKLFTRDYGPLATEFATLLGYKSWKEIQENSYGIFYTETDAFWFATELIDGHWAVWNEEGQMPHPFTVFPNWKEAIKYLGNLFDESGLPDRYWIKEQPKKEYSNLIDKETQIRVLLYGNALNFACENLGVNDMRTRKYAEVFTVSNQEVYEYITIHGLPQSVSIDKKGRGEGFHYYQEDGKWYTFFRERGQIFNEKTFDDEELGKRYIVTTLLQLSGTGLY